MIEVDQGEREYLVLAVDDGNLRTVLSMKHGDGMALHQELSKYYGLIERGEPAPRPKKKPGFFARLLGVA